MKLTFLGTGAAFTPHDNYQSNMLLTAANGKRLLIDCGSDIRHSLVENNRRTGNADAAIDAVYISHSHSDHCGGLEYLAFHTYFSAQRGTVELFAEENLMRDLWDESLKGGLCCIQGKSMQMADYFTCHPVRHNGIFHWEGIRFELVGMPHVVYDGDVKYSHGLLIGENGSNAYDVFITTDTQFCPDTISLLAHKAAVIFHDCETTSFRSEVHAHYEQLCTLPAAVRNKIWLYHYNTAPDYAPEKDGFRGFVKSGQEFFFGEHAFDRFSGEQESR